MKFVNLLQLLNFSSIVFGVFSVETNIGNLLITQFPITAVFKNDIKFTCKLNFNITRGIREIKAIAWLYNDTKLGEFEGVIPGRKNFSDVLLSKQFTVFKNYHLKAFFDDNEVTSTLILSNVHCKNTGNFKCTVTTLHTVTGVALPSYSVSQSLSQIIKSAKIISFSVAAEKKTVIHGNNYTATCMADEGNQDQPDTLAIEYGKVIESTIKRTDGKTAGNCSDILSKSVEFTANRAITEITCTIEGADPWTIQLNVQYRVENANILVNGKNILGNKTIDYPSELKCTSSGRPEPMNMLMKISSSTSELVITDGITEAINDTIYFCLSQNTIEDVTYNATSYFVYVNLKEQSVLTTAASSSPKIDKNTVLDPAKNTDTGDNTGAIVGGVVGGLVVIVIIVVIVIVVMKKKGKGVSKYPNSTTDSAKPATNATMQEDEPDIYKSVMKTPGKNNQGFTEDDYLNNLQLSSQGRSRDPVMLNESTYSTPYPNSNPPPAYSHSRPV